MNKVYGTKTIEQRSKNGKMYWRTMHNVRLNLADILDATRICYKCKKNNIPKDRRFLRCDECRDWKNNKRKRRSKKRLKRGRVLDKRKIKKKSGDGREFAVTRRWIIDTRA